MTSSKRHLNVGQPKWDYNIQCYKPNKDVFFESGLFSILFLACGRPDITRRCLLSTVDAVSRSTMEVEWIFVENGGSNENLSLFNEIPLDRKVIIRQDNYGINQGINQAWSISRCEFCMIHENYWEDRSPSFDFISTSKDIFDAHGDLGIIQLRAIYDHNENWGMHKEMYNPWSCNRDELTKIKIFTEETKSGHRYLISSGFYGFNNNPILMRKTLYRQCGPYPEAQLGSDPRHGETFYQSEVLKTGCAIAHIGVELFYHCGQVTTKAN